MLGLDGRDLALDCEDFLVIVRAGQQVEDVDRPRERLATCLERGDGVGECRRGRIAGDGRDLGDVRGKCAGKGFPEMVWLNAIEVGYAEPTPPLSKGLLCALGAKSFWSMAIIWDLKACLAR